MDLYSLHVDSEESDQTEVMSRLISFFMTYCHIVGFLMLRLNYTYFLFHKMKARNNLKSCHYWPANDTPSEWRFTDRPIVAPHWKDS